MNIGKRLRVLREAKKLSQGDVEKRAGLLRSHISRVECGHTMPSLKTLEKWADALDLEFLQLFGGRHGQSPAAKSGSKPSPVGTAESKLLRLFGRLRGQDQALLLSFARNLARRGRQL